MQRILPSKQTSNIESKSGLKYSKNLETLCLNFNIIQEEISPISLKKILLKNTKTLKSLSLTFSDNNPQILKAFTSMLRQLPNINSISLDFSNCQQLTDPILQDLSLSLSRCLKLQSLNIKLNYCLNTSVKGRRFLYQNIKKLPKLNNINLDFRYCSNIINKDLVNLSKTLQRSSRLSCLKLAWAGSKKINASGIKALSISLRKLRQPLKSLSLGFNDIPSVTDRELEDLAGVFHNMKDLASIELNFKQRVGIVEQEDWRTVDFKKISDRGMQALLSALKDHKGLMSLLLNFKECYQAGEKMIKALALALKDSLCLKRVKLNFGCQANVNKKVIQEFCMNLKGLNAEVDLGTIVPFGKEVKKRSSLFKTAKSETSS